MKKLYTLSLVVGTLNMYPYVAYADPIFLSSLVDLQQQNKVNIDNIDAQSKKIDLYYSDDSQIGKNCVKAAKEYQQIIDTDQSDATYHLGQLYFIGCGVPVNTEKAISLYKKSAAMGNKNAVEILRIIDSYTPKRAQALIMKVQQIQNQAHYGNAQAQYQLAMLYLYSQGIKDNNRKSLNYLQKSSKQHYLPAQYEEGNFYFIGNGTLADPVKGVAMWKNVADASLPDKLRKDQFVKDAVVNAALKLGQVYFTGQDGIARDEAASFYYYRKAAILGSKDGMQHLAMMYQQGIGVKQNTKKSQEWFNKLK